MIAVKKEAFYIIGIGASAGGLNALKEFFSSMPPGSGLGFVLVQHLDPKHQSSLVEILSKYTPMEVIQIEDGVEVKPNHVYVIPPNKNLDISNGLLHLSTIEESHGLKMPINKFLKSLAEDQKGKSIGIILSGFGADGATGVKDIKSEGGLVIIQDPETAESDGMPISAINTGVVDFILPPKEMPDKLISYVNTSQKMSKAMFNKGKPEADLQKIFNLIKARTGNDFSSYKESTMYRRISKRANLHQIDDINKYIHYLEHNPEEINKLFKELLINVTSFFRDPEAYDIIKSKALPELISSKNEGDSIRVWVPGCSRGEEVYSLAIILREMMESFGKYFEVQIFGTDIDEFAINTARKGIYPSNIKEDVNQERLKKFFINKDGKYQIKNEIREMAVFAAHNILKDPPFAKLDLISCRNLLIYLKSDAQNKLLSIFSYALNEGGILVLGPSESIGEFLESYHAVNKKWKIYKIGKSRTSPLKPVEFTTINFPPSTEKILNPNNFEIDRIDVSNLAIEKLLEIYAPSSVIIDNLGEILYIHGKIGKYLEPSPGKASLNVYHMVKGDLGFKLRSAVQSAINQKKDVMLEELKFKDNGESIVTNIVIKPIQKPEIMRDLLIISFEDVKVFQKKEKSKIETKSDETSNSYILKLEQELRKTKERLNITVDEMETSYEELKAANEELQSMNEESQSTNEELETSKEEMQSVNEELATVNSELQTTIDELISANDDMKNLFNSTEIATIFLDKELNIRNFTHETSTLIKVRKSDIGRPIGELASDLKYQHLEEDIKKVMRKFSSKEKEIETNDGIWYLMRITPYRTSEDKINGVVITFLNIHQRKTDQIKLEEAFEYSESIFNTVREPLLVLDEDLKILSANNSFYKKFKVLESQTIGKRLYDLGNKQWSIPKLHTLLEDVLPKNKEFNDFEVEHQFPEIGYKKMLLNARYIYQKNSKTHLILLAMEDKT